MSLSHKVISATTGQTATLFNNSIKESQLKLKLRAQTVSVFYKDKKKKTYAIFFVVFLLQIKKRKNY